MDQNLSHILGAAEDPLLLIDDHGKILWHNQATVGRFGRNLEHLSSILAEFDVRTLLASGPYSGREFSIKLPSGQSIPQAAILLEVGSGAPEGTNFLICLKSQPSQARRLEQREEFLATAAHDLKNPLGAILGYVDVLIDTPKGHGIDDSQRHILEHTRDIILRAIDLVKNYQQLAWLQSGIVHTTSALTDLNVVVDMVVQTSWRDTGRTAPLTLSLSLLPVMVSVESIYLDRIISNLLSNALKYTPHVGKIEISTEQREDRGVLRVCNSAPVIPTLDLPHLFERSYRGATSKGTSGSGLGLYIVKQIVCGVGGSINVSSSEARGTEFVVELPR